MPQRRNMSTILPSATTGEILAELGQRLRRYRLQQNRTIEDVADDAGLAYRTVQRAEAGQRPTLESIIRILRALGRLDALDAFLPAPLVSPLQLAELEGRERRRAGTPRRARRPGSDENDDG